VRRVLASRGLPAPQRGAPRPCAPPARPRPHLRRTTPSHAGAGVPCLDGLQARGEASLGGAMQNWVPTRQRGLKRNLDKMGDSSTFRDCFSRKQRTTLYTTPSFPRQTKAQSSPHARVATRPKSGASGRVEGNKVGLGD
jgi:hypothetical protein